MENPYRFAPADWFGGSVLFCLWLLIKAEEQGRRETCRTLTQKMGMSHTYRYIQTLILRGFVKRIGRRKGAKYKVMCTLELFPEALMRKPAAHVDDSAYMLLPCG